jgi:hypothetical protein
VPGHGLSLYRGTERRVGHNWNHEDRAYAGVRQRGVRFLRLSASSLAAPRLVGHRHADAVWEIYSPSTAFDGTASSNVRPDQSTTATGTCPPAVMGDCPSADTAWSSDRSWRWATIWRAPYPTPGGATLLVGAAGYPPALADATRSR